LTTTSSGTGKEKNKKIINKATLETGSPCKIADGHSLSQRSEGRQSHDVLHIVTPPQENWKRVYAGRHELECRFSHLQKGEFEVQRKK
jgi:hypothetical protein